MSPIRKNLLVALIAFDIVIFAAIGWALFLNNQTSAPAIDLPLNVTPSPSATPDQAIKPEPITGIDTRIGDAFSITVPDGWRASVSTTSSFYAIEFAEPDQIASLVYNPGTKATIGGDVVVPTRLTEHFFMRSIANLSQAFRPTDHSEVTKQEFAFEDGTKGTKYNVTKHASEAQKWGGLQKDSQWNGRVYVYTKDGKTVEAHLAYYPSTKIDVDFFEKVVKTIKM